MIGRIHRVPLREVWAHEAYDFTRWLQENLDVLNEVLGTSFANAEREQSAGAFSVDIVAEDENKNAVIIENQLERSDHDHLGKLLTYLVAVEAKTAVWLVADPRPEHVSTITWLNESSTADFYLVRVEAVRIGESAPAPLLTKIVGPSVEGREAGDTRRDLAERYHLRQRFWSALLDLAKQRTRLHANISPTQDTWVSASSGIRGFQYLYSITQHEARVALYIDRGPGNETENRAIFTSLHAQRETIEHDFGGPLEWVAAEGTRSCRVAKTLGAGGYHDEAAWPGIQAAMVEAMIRLEAAVRPYLKALPTSKSAGDGKEFPA